MKVFKTIFKSLWDILSKISWLVYIIVPFLHNNISPVCAHILWLFALILNCICVFIYFINGKPSAFKNPIIDSFADYNIIPGFVLFAIFFVNNYYSLPFWSLHRALCIFVMCYVPIMCFKFANNIFTAWKLSSFYVAATLFIMFLFENWLIGQFIFGGIAMLIIFYNCAQLVLKNHKSPAIFILQDFLIGIALTIYLIYIIPNKGLQGIILTIISTVYCGLLTLLGVAWTIKVSEDKLNKERRLSQKPYLFVQDVLQGSSKKDVPYSWFCNNGQAFNIQYLCYLKNTDNGIAILKYIKSKTHSYTAQWLTVIDKGKTFRLVLKKDIEDISKEFVLVVEDVLGNSYSYAFQFDEADKKVVGLKEIDL